MKDIEVLKRAKLYMEQLAIGTDPISGVNAPNNSFIHQERLKRCFLYVAGILDEVIENGGSVSNKTYTKKLAFNITKEQQSEIEISDDPVGVSVIAKRITAVLPPDMKKLLASDINLWCVLKGYLREDTYSGKTRRVASLKGEQLGISTLDRVNKQGYTFKYNTFNSNAQKFIVENLNNIATDLEAHRNS